MIFAEASEAENNLAHLLDRVAEGEQILITRQGALVARPLPVAGQPILDRHAALARLTEPSQGLTLNGLSVKAMIAEKR